MKLIISSAELHRSLSALSKAIPSKSALPILENFLFAVDGNSLQITASDGELTMRTEIETESTSLEGGKIAVPAKHMMDLLKELPDQPLTITTVNDKIYVSNDYDFGYVMSVFTNADKDTCVKLSNGNIYNISDMIAAEYSQLSDVVENTYILIFMDYNGEAVGFRCV